MRALAPLLLFAACGGGSASGSGSVSASASVSVAVRDDLRNPAALAACSNDRAGEQLAIVSDLRDSYHEMVVCGGLALSWSISVVGVLADALVGKKSEPAMIYKGNGIYASRNGMMEIQTVVTGSGAVVPFNVLDPHSYFTGFSVQAQVSGAIDAAARGKPWEAVGKAAASAKIGFQGEGPGFALLGMTITEARAGKFDFKKIARSLGDQISVINKITVNDKHGNTTVHYRLVGKPQRLNEWIDGKRVPMTLAGVEATHSVTGQTIKITDWNMEFRADGGRVLDGSIAFDVEGGTFPYAVKLTYPHRVDPDVALTCR